MRKLMISAVCAILLISAVGMLISSEKTKPYYVCNCKDNCKCDFVSGKAGKCKCGSPLAAMHLLAIKKNTAVFCRCGENCTCELSKTDPGKCGCGKDVKVVGIQGKYVCACGSDCKCNTLADKPGKCRCGKDLKKVS